MNENLVLIINEPSHNPTGFRMTYEEWVEVYTLLKITDCNINCNKGCSCFE